MVLILDMHQTNAPAPIRSLLSLDLNLLKALHALWQCRGITAAGRMIGLSQPAMSHALQRLRLAFADELFVRGPGVLVPTPRGTELCLAASAALSALERVAVPAEPFQPGSSTRRFRIGMNDYVSATLLPRMVQALAGQAPQAALEVIHLPRGQNQDGPLLPRLLDEGRIELALGQIDDLPPRCRRQKLREDPHVCALARAAWPAARPFDIGAYTGLRHVRVSSFPERRSWVEKVLEAQGLTRRIAVTVPHFMAALHLVARTDLVTTLPLGAVAPFAEALGLHVLPSPLPERLHHLDMAWLNAGDGDQGLAWLRGMIVETVLRG
ncbi:LysR family transcriptional regulator [Falsiroseomonas ponticola]|jgi:DNA-binding transcriptional LysR family regulator|uniref:LysR family transcriptional regulator n=1 Tax=Falsiroseomonas ponticola TaxID=2786951 RepID=UPI0019336BB9|nr:LysR family transcriptional regulator [Roseomonas ponticola]